MTVHTDESFGIVPLFHNGKEWLVLLIEQISHRGSERRFWTLPKGHAEEGETGMVAALRELQEETGITVPRVEEERVFIMQYSFTHEDLLIEKKVHFYLGYCNDMETEITQPDEVASLDWFTLEEAGVKVTHENARILLQEVVEFLSLKS